MNMFCNPTRQLEFIVGYHFTQAQRRFASDANVFASTLIANPEMKAIKSKVRKMKKV